MKLEDVKSVVSKSPDFVAAEMELSDIQLRQQALTVEIGKFNAQLGDESSLTVHAATQEITRLEQDQKRLSQRSAELRRAIELHKPIHARAVRASMGHQRRNAATRIAKAIQDYEAALTDLKAADRILDAIGANQQKISEIPFVKKIAASVDRVIAECAGDLTR